MPNVLYETPRKIQSLFQPGSIGPLAVPNRMVMAPMTRSRAGEGKTVSDLTRAYYRQRASAALIITEASQVSTQGVGYPNTPGIHTDAQVAAWRAVVDDVHAAGGHIVLQLWHVGRVSHSMYHDGRAPVAPSAIAVDGEIFTAGGMKPFETPRALDASEIAEVVDDFRHGAEMARLAGFDGVEIHAANGYLIDQFLRDGANRRTDRYGGAIENRLRFPLEVVDAVTEVFGADRVGVRVSPLGGFNSMADSDPESLFRAFAGALGRRGLAYLHIITDDAFADDPRSFDQLSLGDAFGGTIIAAGGYDAESGAAEIDAGRADFVAYGRSFLANPDLPARFAQGADLNDPDPGTFYGGGSEGYTDYPVLDG
jgi:N-ethylmaleimide reductase